MKKLILGLLSLLLSCSLINAQQPEKTKQKTENKTTGTSGCYMMQDGKMYHVIGAKEEPMTGEVTLKNGTKIMTNGTCKMKEGKNVKLQNGQCCDESGKIGKHIIPKIPK